MVGGGRADMPHRVVGFVILDKFFLLLIVFLIFFGILFGDIPLPVR